jgi:DNA-binding LytR/AlgR family response regulator
MEKEPDIKNIIRVETKGDNTYLFYTDGKRELTGNTIDDLERAFLEWDFVRIHPRHLINKNFYKKMSAFSFPAVEMNDGTLLPVSKDMIENGELNMTKTWKQKIIEMFKF